MAIDPRNNRRPQNLFDLNRHIKTAFPVLNPFFLLCPGKRRIMRNNHARCPYFRNGPLEPSETACIFAKKFIRITGRRICSGIDTACHVDHRSPHATFLTWRWHGPERTTEDDRPIAASQTLTEKNMYIVKRCDNFSHRANTSIHSLS